MTHTHKTDDQEIEHVTNDDNHGGSTTGTQTGGIQDESQAELDKLKNELEVMTETAKRTMADIQNMKRRQDEEKSTIIYMANAALIKGLLPSLDGLNRAKQHVPEGAEDWAKGIQMCIEQINQTMQSVGLTPIESVGTTFNPDLHEAITSGAGEQDTVIEELEKGYTLGDKVLRHAKVKIGNGE